MKTKLFTFLTVIIIAITSCKKESCSDGIQNQNETGIDCGGSCSACPTCNDGLQNQNETGVDCGGPCSSVCPTCSDGIQNQNETGIDCGGPCISCNQKYLCDGNGSANYFPLKLNNRWDFKGNGNGDDYWWIAEDTVVFNSIKYFALGFYYEGGWQYNTLYFRIATNNDVYRYETNDGNEYLHIPASPTVNQQWTTYGDIKKVISTNASLTTSKCSYTGLLHIGNYNSNGTLIYEEYFKKGTGKVYNSNSLGYDQLISVVLN